MAVFDPGTSGNEVNASSTQPSQRQIEKKQHTLDAREMKFSQNTCGRARAYKKKIVEMRHRVCVRENRSDAQPTLLVAQFLIANLHIMFWINSQLQFYAKVCFEEFFPCYGQNHNLHAKQHKTFVQRASVNRNHSEILIPRFSHSLIFVHSLLLVNYKQNQSCTMWTVEGGLQLIEMFLNGLDKCTS